MSTLTVTPIVRQLTVTPTVRTLTIQRNASTPTGPAGGDLSGSYPNPAVETRGRIAYTTQYRMDGTGAGDFLAPTSDSGAVAFSTYAEMTTQQGVFRSRCALRHAGPTLPGTPTWQLGQHAGVEVEASVRVVDYDTATHQFHLGIHRLHTCPDLVTIGAETLVGFYPKNGTWWVGVYISDGMNQCDNAGVVNFDTGISVSVDRLLRVVAFPGQSGALFYIGGVPVYRYSGALEDSFYATIAYLGCMLQDRAGTSAFGAKVRVNSMVARHTMARNDPRLSDARTPLSHTHGNLTNAGAIGSTSGLPIKTGTAGVLEAGAFGTTAGTFCEGNDARLAAQTITLTGDVTGSGTGSFAATIANNAVTYAKMQNVSAATRLLGRGDSGSGDPQEITLGSGLIMGGTVLGWDRAALDDNYGDITVSGGGATWTIDPDAVSYSKIQNVSATDRLLGRSSAGAGDIEEIVCTAYARGLLDDADAATARTTLGLGTTDTPTFAGLNLLNGEFISNASNGRIDLGPNGIDPASPAEDFMALTIDGTWGFGVFLGTRNTRTDALNTGNILFQVPCILNNDTRFSFGSSQNYFLRHVSGSSLAGLACGLLVNNAGSTGSLVLVQGNEVAAANRIPTTAHADPTLYLYGRGSANANDFVRANHDTTNGLVESGRGKLRLKGASVVRIEGPSGGFDLPATAGSNGQVLTTDGSNASWQTPTGGGGGVSEAFAIAMAVAL